MTRPVPQTLTKRLLIALAVAALSFAFTTVQGAVRVGYDAWQQAVSALSLGPSGWVQTLNLILFGIAMLTTVSPWRRILAGGRGARAYPILTALTAFGFIVVGIVRQDPAPGYDPDGLALHSPTPLGLVHISVAGVAALSSVAGLLVMASRFAGDPSWRRWPLYSMVAAIGMIVCVAAYAVLSVKPTGFAGAFERGAMLIPMIWTYAFLRRLDHGAPFMASQSSSPRAPNAMLELKPE